MGDSSAAALAAASEARMRHRLMLRVLALAGLAVVCVLFTAVGENRFWLAGLLLALTPVPVILPRVVRPHRWMLAQSTFDVAATVALIGFVPDVWTAGLVIVMSSPTAGAALLGRRAYLGLSIPGVAGLGVVAHLTDVLGWEVPLAVGALMIPLVASYVDVFFNQELQAA
jgi:hypothetical protein